MPQDFFSVSELNNMIRDVLTSGFPRAVWVCGEVQSYDRNKGKPHAFFELVEKDPGSQEVKARTGLVIWANTRPRIEAVLRKAENAFELKDDIEVKFLCRVDFYPGFGQVRLIVENIDPVHTLGKIAQDRQKLIAELSKSGLLQKNKTLALPLVPLNVGLITAFDSAAYHDFIDELGRSSYAFKVYLARALMQGKNAPSSVCAAIAALQSVDQLDLIVITRGGGSIAELACFDSREIVAAIAQSKYPVVTGIGHEINTTIADLAAHTYAKTPTATAQLLVARVREFVQQLEAQWQALKESASGSLQARREHVKDAVTEIRRIWQDLVAGRREHHVRLAEQLRALPLGAAARAREDLLRSSRQLKNTIQLRLQSTVTKIGHCEKLIAMASPANILKRGFSITRSGRGKLVTSALTLKEGQSIRTEFIDGEVESIVAKGA